MDSLDEFIRKLDEELEQKYKVVQKQSFDNIIVLDQLPIIKKERYAQLLNVMTQILNTITVGIVTDVPLYLVQDDEGKTKGMMFVEYETREQAEHARKALDGYALSRNDRLRAVMFNDIDKYASIPDQWKPPPKEEYQELDFYRSWLLDANCRDQFVIQYQDETSILWNMKSEAPEQDFSRKHWTESYVEWSPRGSYLTTLHKQGVALWGGPKWKKIIRFFHNGAKYIHFSPNEKYLVTWSNENSKEQPGKNLLVWEVRTGNLLRSFSSDKKAEQDGWPMFKWSPDDKYLAKMGKGRVEIYQTPDMNLVDKEPLPVAGVKDFSWSPKQNIIAFWTPEADNNPARVTLMDIPSKNIVRTKNLFNVQDCKFFWQSDGEFLAVIVDRFSKTKKSTFTNIELFRIREKEIPVEVLEMKDEVVKTLSWEPKGSCFSIIHGEQPNLRVSFYSLEKDLKHLKTLDKKTVSHLYWSPKGQLIVLAALDKGILEFWNVEGGNAILIGNVEHPLATDIQWDPTGRYVLVSVSIYKHSTGTGYGIYDFKGTLLFRQEQSGFRQILWRPRPPTLLSKDKIKEIKKNYKTYATEFAKIDELIGDKATIEAREKRRRLMEEWAGFMDKVRKELDATRKQREEIRGYASDDDEGQETVEEYIEEIIEETKIPLKEKK